MKITIILHSLNTLLTHCLNKSIITLSFMTTPQSLVNFCLSKDLQLPVRFKLLNLSGITRCLAEYTYTGANDDDLTSRIIRSKLFKEQQLHHTVIITAVVESGEGRPITCPIVTSVNYHMDSTTRLSSQRGGNSHWIRLPIEYSKLPLDAELVLKFYNYDIVSGKRLFVGQSRLSLFDRTANCTLTRGYQSLKIDMAHGTDETNTEYIDPPQLAKLEAQLKLKEDNQSSSEPWIDQMSYRKMEQLNGLTQLKMREQLDGFAADQHKSGPVYVNLELNRFEMPVVFSDVKYAELNITTSQSHPVNQGGVDDHFPAASTANNVNDFNQITYQNSTELKDHPSTHIFDPDQYRVEVFEDPIEFKFRRLERTHQLSPMDRDVKPTLKVRNELDRSLKKQFFEKLTPKERNLIWKFRFYLLHTLVVNGNNEQYNNFIVNFIKCIDWDDEFEVNEFLNVLRDFDSKSGEPNLFIQELTIVDCLELLGENYQNKIVRSMAINRLRTATNEELEMFMVQLVQAIRYEPATDVDLAVPYDAVDRFSQSTSSDFQMVDKNDDPITKYLFSNTTEPVPQFSSPLSDFIIERAIQNTALTNYFYWNLKVQVDEERANNIQSGNQPELLTTMASNDATNGREYSNQQQTEPGTGHRHVYERTLLTLISRLRSAEGAINTLRRQVDLVRQLHNISEKVGIEHRRDTTARKLEVLKKLLSHKTEQPNDEHRSKKSLLSFDPLAIPLNPDVNITGTVPDSCAVFKSSLSPLKIEFKANTTSGRYPVMYKVGDDLRQDQFVIQIITLMNRILKNENLDLKLTPYRILATGTVEGLIEFVQNSSLSSILQKYNNSILSYLQKYNPDSSAPHGVKLEAMDTYVRSCAGYCVITYILGVGDRHLENLLLTKDGYFFHADFGYILGADPKPFPPQMKLPIQVIEGMGGLADNNYQKFCNYCFITYLTLRRNASMILNLFQLMINQSVPALRTVDENNESEKMELIWKVQEKFMLDLDDEEAVLHFQRLIDDSVNAFYPVVIDRLHSMAQYWRA